MKIRTDHRWKHFFYGYEVPKGVHNEFAHLDEDARCDGWLRYRNRWYHISEFLVCEGGQYGEWQGYCGNPLWGILIKVSRDGERYMIGAYC